jgi:hypothetical protein
MQKICFIFCWIFAWNIDGGIFRQRKQGNKYHVSAGKGGIASGASELPMSGYND